MTLAAAKKLIFKLPLKERLRFADELVDSIPPMREPVTLAELERRADEVISGKVKGIPWEEFERDLDKMVKAARASAAPGRGRRSPK